MNLVPTIGLEIHSQLATNTKIFCGCSTAFGGEPNTHCCPVCLGMPGVLPVLNRRVVELAMRMALLTGGAIQPVSWFARKNYFYPDLPKGYQISMLEFPLIKGGGLTIHTSAGEKFIRLNRIHLEEDAGKLIHAEGRDESWFDVNRCGVPLIEMVTEPDFDSVDEVTVFLGMLKELLIFSGASHGNMEQGNLRVDANISVRPAGSPTLGTRTEIKNMNSFANAAIAITREIDRQIDHVGSGGTVVQETLLYDAARGVLSSMRSKEEAHDYRYFPEPDLVPVHVDDNWIARVKAGLPESRDTMRARYEHDHGLPAYDAEVLTTTPGTAAYFDQTVAAGADPKKASNWIMREVLREVNDRQIDIADYPVAPALLADLLAKIDGGVISASMGTSVLQEMVATKKTPDSIIQDKGLAQISDTSELETVAQSVLDANPDEVALYRGGKTQLLGFFMGEIMKATRGKANPAEVNRILRGLLA